MRVNASEIRAALAAIDVTTETAELERLSAEAKELKRRAKEAEEAVMQLSRQIREAHEPNAKEIADALVGGSGAMEAARLAPAEGELRARRSGLQAGLKELAARQEAKRREAEAIRQAVRDKVARALAPTVAEIRQQARAAAGEIVEAYGALEAIRGATSAFVTETLEARQAAGGVAAGFHRLLHGQPDAVAPPDLVDALSKLEHIVPGRSKPVSGKVRII